MPREGVKQIETEQKGDETKRIERKEKQREGEID